ncbi:MULTISPECIES: glycosyltransferase [Pseudomonas]|uniref:Glycosyltransferase family 4 protein n=1 Tax=Pseudomonas mosselii TaxID=78327 RepID=A0A5R8Z5W2_9PSED|nr:glycosyltransferase [Pseudomonas mosselii]TLP61139.1 glycosyltransferase family 4 protein [Pseudomonas mosselii]
MLSNDRQIDRRILLQADSLQEAGWQVVILAMPLDRPAAGEDCRVVRIGADKECSARRESRVLHAYRQVRRWLPMNGYLMRLLKSIAWRWVVDQERFYLNLFLADGRRYPAQVVVAHDLPMLAVGRTLAQEFGASLVYDSHELFSEQEFARWQQRAWANVERRHIHACERVITVNPSIAGELQARYDLPQVSVIHNAERVMPLAPRSRYLHQYFSIPEDHLLLLFQGGFSAGRNLENLTKAMALLRSSDVHLVMLGEGALGDSLQRLAIRLGVQNRVHYHPAVPQHQLLEITASADAGVIPYQAICLNNYYCTPNKLFEFIAAGLPILASDLPELRRLVAGNAIGHVCELATAQQIARAIEEMFADRSRLLAWREQLMAVRDALSWQHEGERLKQIYEGLK